MFIAIVSLHLSRPSPGVLRRGPLWSLLGRFRHTQWGRRRFVWPWRLTCLLSVSITKELDQILLICDWRLTSNSVLMCTIIPNTHTQQQCRYMTNEASYIILLVQELKQVLFGMNTWLFYKTFTTVVVHAHLPIELRQRRSPICDMSLFSHKETYCQNNIVHSHKIPK